MQKNITHLFLFFFFTFVALNSIGQAVLVKDILPGVNLRSSSFSRDYITMGNYSYFTAEDYLHGTELWRTDGTEEGTTMVKDIWEGPTSSQIHRLFVLNGTLFFVAQHPSYGRELWKSDGTEAGTMIVKDLNPGNLSISVGNINSFNGKLIFDCEIDDVRYLYVSDGTAEGTIRLKAIGGFNASRAVGDKIFFISSDLDGLFGDELWVSDGTAIGTKMVKDINPVASASSNPANMVVFNGALYFTADDGTNGTELWKSDGTENGTVMLKDIDPTGSAEVRNLLVIGNMLFFSAVTPSEGAELWKTDGTENGTVLVKDILLGTDYSSPRNFTNVNGTLFFSAHDGTSVALWKSNGTTEGTVRVKDINPGNNFAGYNNFISSGENLFFVVNSKLYKSDGTENGTLMVYDGSTSNQRPVDGKLFFTANSRLWFSDGTLDGTINLNPDLWANYLTVFNGKLLFTGEESIYGQEPYISDGTISGTKLLKNIHSRPFSSNPDNLIKVNDELYFTVNINDNKALWKSNGTSEGTVLVKEIDIDFQAGITSVGNLVFFSAYGDATGYELWKSDGTEAGTVMVKDIFPNQNSSQISSLLNVGGTLFFSATDGINGYELWKSDGTEGGTVMVKDIFSGSNSSNPFIFTDVNGTLFFTAFDGNNLGLWKTDGTEAGTVFISSSPSAITNCTNVNGTLFFTDSGINLWKSDGTGAGTVIVKSIDASNLVSFNGLLYFRGNDNVSGAELWKSDGTDAGTELVKDIRQGANGSSPGRFRVVNNTLFFTASDGVNNKLYKTDGTTAGTSLLKDVYPGSDSEIRNLVGVNGTLYFTADNGINGQELWKSDGTVCGTHLAADIFEGTGSSNISKLTEMGGILYFSARDNSVGVELWKYLPQAPVDPVVTDGFVCKSGDNVVLTASGTIEGNYRWYNSEHVLIAGEQNSTFSTPITSDTTFYVSIIPVHGCQSDKFPVYGRLATSIDLSTTVLENAITANQSDATYQWIDCNNSNQAIANQTGRTFLATTSGDYAAVITIENCSDTTACVNVVVAGIESISLQGFAVYPNPTSGMFTIDLSSNTGLINYSIISVDGRLIQQKSTYEKSIQVDLSNQSAGLYILKIESNNRVQMLKINKL
jgi:ELWxxDGT repeat protein